MTLNLPLRNHDINPLNGVWNQFKRYFEFLPLSRLAMEGEIVNYWHLLRDEDFVYDLYGGMKNLMSELILKEGSFTDVDH